MRYERYAAGLAALVALACTGRLARAQAHVTTSGGDVITDDQKNVMNDLIVGDSLELEQARVAAAKATNPALRAFASSLVDQSTRALSADRKLASAPDIGRAANPMDTSGEMIGLRMLDSLRDIPAGPTFDRVFARQQVVHNQLTLQMLRELRPAAKDDDLRQAIARTMPKLRSNLAEARRLSAELGAPMGRGMRRRMRH